MAIKQRNILVRFLESSDKTKNDEWVSEISIDDFNTEDNSIGIMDMIFARYNNLRDQNILTGGSIRSSFVGSSTTTTERYILDYFSATVPTPRSSTQTLTRAEDPLVIRPKDPQNMSSLIRRLRSIAEENTPDYRTQFNEILDQGNSPTDYPRVF